MSSPFDQYQRNLAERLAVRPTLDTDGTACRITLSTTSAASAADVDAFKTNIASTAGVQTFTGADFQGLFNQTTTTYLSAPRQFVLVLSSHADWDATTATLIAYSLDGTLVTETLAIPNGGNTTLTTTGYYLAPDSLSIPAQSGAGGTATFGYGANIAAGKYLAYVRDGGAMCHACWGATAVLPATGLASPRATFSLGDNQEIVAPGGTPLSAILTGTGSTGELSIVMQSP